ncbi:hypothetical protein H6P81_000638 [Aristolochia fimbriata]|uniref:Embryonic flower 1 n=1 Tax=Aristolochia fimbriata TaxID=158543 RepID=A0AAV7F7A5_ARIFI|nr:hypothetical protein H6P81_000638 [Aristolochia fimbriata]
MMRGGRRRGALRFDEVAPHGLMDYINEKDHNAGTCLAVIVPKSGGHLSGSIPIDRLDNAVDHQKQETSKCGHFSIRRYVSDVRKKDWKSCWPFPISDDHHELERCSKLLPPLSVPEFRWWDCQNCTKKNGTDRAGEVARDYNGDQRPIVAVANGEALLPSDNPIKVLDGVQSGKGTCKGGDVAENVLESSAHEKEVNSIIPFIGEALEKVVQCTSPERDNQVTENHVNQIDSGTVCDVIDGEPCERRERAAEDTCEVTITFDLNQPACNLSLTEPISTGPISCDPVPSELTVTRYLGNDEHFQVLPNQEISFAGSHLASPISMNEGGAEPNGKNDLEVSVEITKEIPGRSPLFDVITGGNMCHNAATVPVNELHFPLLTETDDVSATQNFNLNTSESPTGPSNNMLQQKRTKKMRSLVEILKSEESEFLVFSNENHRNQSKGKGNKQKKVLGVENSEPFLTCGPKDMLEKLQGHVVDDGSNRLGIHVAAKTGEKDKENISTEKEHSEVAREERQHLTVGKDDCSREAVTMNNDSALSKNAMSKKSKKLPRIIDDLNSFPKDSPAIDKCRTIQDSQLPQEVIVYKRADPVNNERHQDASLDDIPMDIVELLAKNQHERCLQNAEAAKEGMVDKSATPQNVNMIDFIGKSMENSEQKVDNPTHTSSNVNDIGFKQPERRAQGFVPWSQSRSKTNGIQFRPPDLRADHETMSLTCSQWLEQCHKNQMGLSKNSFELSKHGAAVSLHTIPHNDNFAKAGSSTNSDVSYSLKSTNLDFYFEPQRKKVKFQAEMNREHFTPSSYPIAMKGRNTGGQMEMPASETMPAMDLLRLMNQGACSSTPTTRMRESQGNVLQENHFGHSQAHKFFDLESGGVAGIMRSSPHHRSSQSIHQKQQQGNSFELFPRMARVSSVPLSSDIPTRSNVYGLSVGFTPGVHTERQASVSQARKKKKARNAPLPGQSINLRPNDFVPRVNISSDADILRPRGVLSGHNIEQMSKEALALPAESSRNTEICVVNRNPADFTIPEDGNIYMIGSDDLKCKKLSPLKEPDARKRQRTLKLKTIQGY